MRQMLLDPLTLPDAAGSVLLQSSFFGDVGGDHNLWAIRKSRPAGSIRVIGAPYLNHQRAEEKMAPSPTMKADLPRRRSK
jgi:hypothetical protein